MSDSPRIEFTFTGTSLTPLSLDPSEFADQTAPKVTEEIMRLLASIAPHVSFFRDDVELAAEVITSANVRPE